MRRPHVSQRGSREGSSGKDHEMSNRNTLTAPGRARPSKRAQQQKRKHGFLRGPIPLNWLVAAARLPGRSLHVGLALWVYGDCNKSCGVPLSNISGQRFGLDRNAKYRALAWLEGARLVSVRRKLGRSPIVTILKVGGADERQP